MTELARRPTRRHVAAHHDARGCAAVVREHGRTFYLASWLLSPPKRRDAYALYAFCRIADDLVDRAQGRYGVPAAPDEVARELADYERALDVALYGARARVGAAALPASVAPHAPVFRELRRVVDAHGVPADTLRELLAGVARDLAPARYETWAELVRYCEGVASSVGVMCTYVFGVDEAAGAQAAAFTAERLRARALPYARTLGVAMQLTNILRDVGEDARRGRCYLPASDLAAFALTPDDVLARAGGADPLAAAALARDPRWTAFAAAMVARARALYDAAAPGIPLLAPDARRCAAACATGYAGILGAIERAGYDTITRRASLNSTRRAAVLWQAWRWRAGAAGAHDVHAPVPDPVALA
ncbi:MAG TPA: phytoene/squalene synthase family protein [Gemmatirosa sp.]